MGSAISPAGRLRRLDASEAILAIDFAKFANKLEKQVDELQQALTAERMRVAEISKQLTRAITRAQRAERELQAEREKAAALKTFVERISKQGIPADINPTIGGRLGDGRDYDLWIRYLHDADRILREQAKDALTPTTEEK